MNTPAYIARRYFFSRYHTQAVNLISAMAVLGVAVGTAALVVVVSAFNGLEDLVSGFYQKFDPDLKITPAQGKTFDPSVLNLTLLSEAESFSYVLEEKVLLQNGNRQYIATLKGVDDNYRRVTEVENSLVQGFYFEQQEAPVPAVLGAGVAYYLSLSGTQQALPLEVMVPKPGFSATADPRESFAQGYLQPVGIFSIQPDFDVQYVLCPLSFAQELLGSSQISALEIQLKPGQNGEQFKEELRGVLGSGFLVKNRLEQQELLFQVMKSEGLVTYLVFSLILGIASFSIFGALIMLMLDKKEHLRTLWSLGMTQRRLQRIFLWEGVLISLTGALLGLGLGLGIYYLQDRFGLITLGQGYVVEAYPVSLRTWDLPRVMFTVVGLGFIITWLSARRFKLR